MSLRKVLKVLSWIALSVSLFVLVTNVWIVQRGRTKIYSLKDAPDNKVALVLGTSKKTSSGGENRYFKERMETAASLYKGSKAEHILVSGDNGSKYYNEPRDMLQALGDLKIADTVVTLDYAGFRTFDSIVRSKEVFGQDKITIVTQRFHSYRALFIADYVGIDAVAVAAGEENSVGNSLLIREVIARTLAVLDLFVLRSQPKYLGEKVILQIK